MSMQETRFERHPAYLRVGDWDTLKARFPELPPTAIIRTIVAKYVDRLRKDTKIEGIEVELTDE